MELQRVGCKGAHTHILIIQRHRGKNMIINVDFPSFGKAFRKKNENLKMLVAQWCLTLCNPVDWTLPDFSVYGIVQARILEWVVIPFSRGSS